jgi:hypothetical protein
MSGKTVLKAIDRAAIDRQDQKPRAFKSNKRIRSIVESIVNPQFDIQTGLECK